MIEGAQAADEVRVPLGAPHPGPAAAAAAAAAGASPASPGAPGREAERGSEPGASPPESPAAERGAELGADEEQRVPYPALAATVFFCLGQTTRPRSWCLRLVCNPYPSRPAGGRGRARGPGRKTPSACAPARTPLFVGPGWFGSVKFWGMKDARARREQRRYLRGEEGP
ncbi:voltage-dependent T-type calcium channel subunit alpha-1H-like [Saimiri boliviensis]|uniref:voltage-dependent T-type calcium channel subunit alpha-1H-like n=1 Tax=Saimiri boliviensis TaxID=27679 RepID=UPI00193D3EBF|nr:voltage-dependent T-type calcium channel subunit alpha-1H-like [Saimiri boliviensis boliviensis]